MTKHGPIEFPPLRARPPYDVRDPELTLNYLVDETRWRRAVRADLLAALLEPLAGLELSRYELQMLRVMAGEDIPTVAVFANLLWRCREDQSLPGGGP